MRIKIAGWLTGLGTQLIKLGVWINPNQDR